MNREIIETYLITIRRRLRLPGLAVAIVQDGQVIYSRGFGSAGSGLAVDPHTPFLLGSLSKSFTALAVIQLVDDGKLRLDDTVQKYIPWFAVAVSAGSDITIRPISNVHVTRGKIAILLETRLS